MQVIGKLRLANLQSNPAAGAFIFLFNLSIQFLEQAGMAESGKCARLEFSKESE
jgi:hypothetical protein